MKRPSRLKQPHLLRRDWVGDAVLTLIAGGILLAAVFLPWVNEDAPGWVNFSIRRSKELNGVLKTHWGWPALGLAVAVLVAGAAMLLTRIGIAAALVALLIVRAEGRAPEEPPAPVTPPTTAPPAPESAPPI